MYNVVTKAAILMASVSISMGMLCSCGDNKEKLAADLFGQAQGLYDAGDYNGALVLLDSIDQALPGALSTRREVMSFRPKVIEKQTLEQLAQADSILAVNLLLGDSLNRTLVYVENPIEGYYVAGSEKGMDVNSVVGLHPRMEPDGAFYLIATCQGKSDGFKLTSENIEFVSPSVPVDGERNDISSNHSVIMFTPLESDSIARFVVDNQTNPISICFNGKSGATALSATQRDAILQVYETAQVVLKCKRAQIDKARLEKRLEVARNQMARLYQDSIDTK